MHARLTALALVALLSVSGCGDARGDGEAGRLVAATTRGLAAGVLGHLDGVDVTRVSGSDAGGALSVWVDTADPALETIHLYVQVEPDPGPGACGTDFGYSSVSCEADGAATTEVLVREDEDEASPDVMGRFHDARRKAVLVQVWGSSDEAAESLVRRLLEDDLMGARTSQALVEAGEELDGYEEEQSEWVRESVE